MSPRNGTVALYRLQPNVALPGVAGATENVWQTPVQRAAHREAANRYCPLPTFRGFEEYKVAGLHRSTREQNRRPASLPPSSGRVESMPGGQKNAARCASVTESEAAACLLSMAPALAVATRAEMRREKTIVKLSVNDRNERTAGSLLLYRHQIATYLHRSVWMRPDRAMQFDAVQGQIDPHRHVWSMSQVISANQIRSWRLAYPKVSCLCEAKLQRSTRLLNLAARKLQSLCTTLPTAQQLSML